MSYPLRALVALLLSTHAVLSSLPARAQEPVISTPYSPPPAFAYTTPPEKNPVRGMLELSGFLAFGFLWYVTRTGISRSHYDLGYDWSMFRKKLSGEAVRLDTNELGTNYIGHPVGGTTYYVSMRSNQMGIGGSFAVAVGGSLLWEVFGEVHEILSLNDMIVTPLAGLAIGEAFMQLGGFFDRSSAALHNRMLAVLFTPVKSLNDLLDGRELLRAEQVDAYGFPTNEWHQFDLGLGVANTWQASPSAGARPKLSQELRLTLSSRLARLPTFATAGQYSLGFDDANVSSLEIRAAATTAGLVDIYLATNVVLAGGYMSEADGAGNGHGTLLGFAVGYQYSLHDYDRDGVRPRDRIASVQPLGLLFEHRAAFGALQLFGRIDAGGEFAAVRPYALRAYREIADHTELSTVTVNHLYYFGLGGHVMATLGIASGPFDVECRARVDAYRQVGNRLSADDQRTALQLRAGFTLGRTPLRISAFAERQSRAGQLAAAHAARHEVSAGIDVGARF